EGGRRTPADREGLGPVRRQRRGTRGRDREGRVETPRTDEQGVAEAGREQPPVEPEVEAVDAPVADAPDTTTTKQMHDDPTKLEQSGEPSRERTRGEGEGSKGSKGGKT
ncbi:MAG TPA: hypothetical protein VG079_07995, partial [Gaiellaceae bacterium]|nr:hypothetical protein [Gaiellaceae bacterium]